jgi:hypothetical protein
VNTSITSTNDNDNQLKVSAAAEPKNLWNVGSLKPLRRSVMQTTMMELSAIDIDPQTGLTRMCPAGYKRPAASGIAIRLNINDHSYGEI